jgi:Arc/MetJ-type ribon-helix-helix transcriptional regulator
MQSRTTIQLSESLRKQLKLLAAKRDLSYQELLKDMISIFQELDKEKTIISIPKKLSQKIKTKIENTDFTSVSEYTTFLLRQILLEDVDQLTFQDEAKIRTKLKKLGYL